jgi:hypothetical protein
VRAGEEELGGDVNRVERVTLPAVGQEAAKAAAVERGYRPALLAQYTCKVACLLAGRIEYPVLVRLDPQ